MSRVLLRPSFAIDFLPAAVATIVVVSGELDLSTAPWLEEQLGHCQRAGISVIVDLEQVEFMDAAGLRVLVSAAERSGPDRFAVTPGPPQVQRLFDLTGMDTMLHVVPPVHWADRAAA